jgi:hypothetical protein
MRLGNWLKTHIKTWFWLISNYPRFLTIVGWSKRNWLAPAPGFVKHSVLLSRPAEVWVETGTYFGETTMILARHSRNVTTIEADLELYRRAKLKFSGSKIKVLFGSSADLMDQAIEEHLNCGYRQINFFLDGHYSGPGTFYSIDETPIVRELEVISSYMYKLKSCHIFIDDFRDFDTNHVGKKLSKYPSRSFLVEFADENNLIWTVEHDIFIMSKNS